MSNKMLIDASHPEETQVVVLRGNRIEEFDFESQEKKQLRGNIYLAKVTRVEPSLQAAFIDYGGNRHGFLAFSEIHPDYYQIPVADRQALLDAEAEEARALSNDDDDDDEGDNNDLSAEERQKAISTDEDAQEAPSEEEPKKKPTKRRPRRSKKAAAEDETQESVEVEAEAEAKAADEEPVEVKAKSKTRTKAKAKAADKSKNEVAEDDVEVAAEAKTKEEKPAKRRTTRRKPAAKKATTKKVDDAAEAVVEDKPKDDDDTPPTTMAAMVEIDMISEDLPDESGEEEASENQEASAEATEATEVKAVEEKEEKPKRRRATRKPKADKKETKAETKKEVEAKQDEATEAETETKTELEATSEEVTDAEAAPVEEAPKKPRAKRTRKKPTKKAKPADEDDSDDDGVDVENLGEEDALEEVQNPKRLRKHYKIQEVIKRRQVLLIQVVKEERGNKGAALTTYLSLAGRYSVLMPNTARGGGISRKITNAADRKRLKTIASKLEVPQGMGVILRTAGASRTESEITRDFEYLMRLWEQVRNLTLSSTAPSLVYEEGSLIKRSIRDLYNKDTGEIIVSGEQGYEEAKAFMEMLMPSHTNKVKLYNKPQPIFSKFGVETQLDLMLTPQVTMKSGGYLVINQTEALVAVDVNSGRSTREHSIEETALQTNLEAAEEAARQLRLRDLAGLIVIDFIDMEEKRNNRAVEKRLKDCLKTDRARIQVGRISHFGLMEMSRQRMRASVLESTMNTCSHCAGTGYVRSETTVALRVYRAIEEHLMRHKKFNLIVKTSPDTAIHLLNHKRAALVELEMRFGLQIMVEGDWQISDQQHKFEKGSPVTNIKDNSVIGFQNEAAFEAVADDGDDESEGDEKQGRKRSRRRGGRKNSHNAHQDSNGETLDASNENASPDGDDDDRPRKKRRRGKRAGRKRHENGEEMETSPQGESVAANNNSGEMANDASPVEAPEQEAEKPKRTTGRKRVTQKAPMPEKPKEEIAPITIVVDASDIEPQKASEPDKPKRRTTRRSSSPAPSQEASSAAKTQTDAPIETKVEASQPESAPQDNDNTVSEAVQATEKGKSKKAGWWRRGGGIF